MNNPTAVPHPNPIIRIKFVATLVNPDGEWAKEIVIEVQPGAQRQQVAIELLRSIGSGGGLVTAELDEVRFVPLARVKEIVVTFPAIELATAMPRLN